MYEKSLILIKPDGLRRRLAARILQRFEDAGFKLHAVRLVQPTVALARAHYAEHVEKAFYPTVERYICSGPVLALVLGGGGAIAKIRQLVGATVPSEAAPGTIRGDFAHQAREAAGGAQERALHNLIHASANAADAEREIAIWFAADEVLDYPLPDDELHGA